METIECPYCKHEYDYNGDYDFNQDDEWENECPKCEKFFMLTAWYEANFSSRQADCLNDGEHDYKPTRTLPLEYVKLRCSVCGDEKPLENLVKPEEQQEV